MSPSLSHVRSKYGIALALVPFLLLIGCKDGAKEEPAAPAKVEDPAAVHPEIWPSPKWPFAADAALEEKVATLLKKMTVEEKVGQVIQGDIASMTPEDMKKYHLGSILAGGGSSPGGDEKAPAKKWLELADAFYAASIDTSNGGVGIPMIWGIDAMHGHSNIVGAVLFPHNVGLGATHNPKLLADIARLTAEQVRTTGIEWTFAPTVTVPQDDRWGRAYEGYSEDPGLVASYAGVFVRGLQGDPSSPDFLRGKHVISSTKHFLADGGTENGRDQGDAKIPETVLRDIHNAGYVPAIEAGVQTVMISFSSWNGEKHHWQQGPDHRRAQEAHELRRLHGGRLERARPGAGLHQRQLPAGIERRPRHVHGAGFLARAVRQHAQAGQGRHRADGAPRRRGHAHPAREIPRRHLRSGSALQASAGRRLQAAVVARAARHRARCRAPVAGHAQEQWRPAAAGG